MCVAAKMARLKQAKEEAEKEIAEYKAKTEQDFQRKLEEVTTRLSCQTENLYNIVLFFLIKTTCILFLGGVENKTDKWRLGCEREEAGAGD